MSDAGERDIVERLEKLCRPGAMHAVNLDTVGALASAAREALGVIEAQQAELERLRAPDEGLVEALTQSLDVPFENFRDGRASISDVLVAILSSHALLSHIERKVEEGRAEIQAQEREACAQTAYAFGEVAARVSGEGLKSGEAACASRIAEAIRSRGPSPTYGTEERELAMAVVREACGVVDADTYKHPMLSSEDAVKAGVDGLIDAVGKWRSAQPAATQTVTPSPATSDHRERAWELFHAWDMATGSKITPKEADALLGAITAALSQAEAKAKADVERLREALERMTTVRIHDAICATWEEWENEHADFDYARKVLASVAGKEKE